MNGNTNQDSLKSKSSKNNKPKLFLTRKLPIEALDKLNEFFELTLNEEDKVLSKAEIIKNVQDKDALLCLLTDTIDKDVFEAGSKLKVVSNYAVGFNNINIDEATRRHIPVCTTPGILTEAVADLTWALILGIARHIVSSDKYTRQGLFKGWGPDLFLGSDVYGKTLGIVGMGRIGQAVAKRAQGFNMKILYTSRTPHPIEGLNSTRVSLNELLQNSDFVSLHTPLTPETHYLIKAEQLKLMKPTAYIINTTRGPVIEEKALVSALKQNQIRGAGLDVYENEPELAAGLKELDNAILLPHIGSATHETRTKMAILAVENAIYILQGKKPHAIVNPEALQESAV